MSVRQPRIMKNRPATDSGKLGRELFGLFTVFCGLLFILSLATFDSRDPWLNHVVSGAGKIHNKAGLFGAYLSGLLYDMIGFAAWIVPLFFCITGARRILNLQEWVWWRWIGFMLLALCMSLAGAARDLDMGGFFSHALIPPGSGNISSQGGGILGHMLYMGMMGWLSTTGTVMIWLFTLLLAIQMITNISWLTLLKTLGISLSAYVLNLVKNIPQRKHGDTGQSRLELDLAFEEQSAFPGLPSAIPSRQSVDAATSNPEHLEPAPFTPGSSSKTDAILSEEAANLELEKRTEPYQQASETGEHGSQSAVAMTAPEKLHPPAATALHDLPEDAQSPLQTPQPQGDLLSFEAQHSHAKRSEADEDDLPPWVRDFEEDKLGMRTGHLLSEPFHMPSASPQVENTSQDTEFCDFLASNTHADESVSVRESAADVPMSGEEPADNPITHRPTADAADECSHEIMEEEDIPSCDEENASEACQQLHAGLLQGAVLSEDAASNHPRFEADVQDEYPALHGYDAPPPIPCAANESSMDTASKGEPPMAVSDRVDSDTKAAPGVLFSVNTPAEHQGRLSLPPLDLLEAVQSSAGATPRSLLEAKGKSLMICLNDFGIQGELAGITPGPVVTMFEVRPAPGVRVSRIANLSDDLALALKAMAVRIQAPVPGTDAVGIEIPNEVRETVCLKELLGSRLFQNSKSLLTLALGKDISGAPAVADLAAMPHLLVAGATGAGKSVGINSIILSLIYKARPEEVKLMLVDPKRVEMAIYADLPHLVHPVVTEMQLAKNALEWAVAEMERRYNVIAKAGVRNILDYNAKVAAFGNAPPIELEDLESLPYLVIIIDELADLMLVGAKEVETSIVRLAQLARAAGIHLILATQRPSVDVVTGLIKANFPCRIAFQVTSKHDSRTILDTVGAEHLLGKGDMLFKPAGGKFQRMHSPFVSDKSVHAVVNYWRSQQQPDYQVDFTDWTPDSQGAVFTGNNGGGGDIFSDPAYNEAVEFVRQQGKASISLIQRKFRIGFNKAARFIEQMEQDGIIGPADGSRPRLVIR